MQVRTIAAVMALFAAGCGGNVKKEVREPLLQGRALYQLRYNPAPCLVNQSEFSFEIVTENGFERVYLDDPTSEEALMTALQASKDGLNGGTIEVDGRILDAILPYAADHYARGFAIYAIGGETVEKVE